MPAALAFVSCGFVLVRVRVRILGLECRPSLRFVQGGKRFFHSPTEGAGARSKQLQGRVHLELSAGVATGLGVEAGIHIVVLIVAVVVVGPGAMEPRTKGRFGDGNGWTRGTRCRRGSSDAHHVVYD